MPGVAFEAADRIQSGRGVVPILPVTVQKLNQPGKDDIGLLMNLAEGHHRINDRDSMVPIIQQREQRRDGWLCRSPNKSQIGGGSRTDLSILILQQTD